VTRLLSACLALLAPAAARAADAAAAPGEAADPRVMVDCTVTNRGRPAVLAASEQIASGIVYEERVTGDQTRLELRWREVSARRWAGRSQVPPDLERCTPLLMEGAAVLVRCRQPADSGVERHRLVRLSPGQPPAVLAPSLILTGRTTLQPLGPGRLLAWVEPPEGAPPEISADEVTAAEIDASGAVAHYAIVSRPYTRRWPAGQAFILTKQGRAGRGRRRGREQQHLAGPVEPGDPPAGFSPREAPRPPARVQEQPQGDRDRGGPADGARVPTVERAGHAGRRRRRPLPAGGGQRRQPRRRR
jgi:hypothetical protein